MLTLFTSCISWIQMFAWQFHYDLLSIAIHKHVDTLPDIFNE